MRFTFASASRMKSSSIGWAHKQHQRRIFLKLPELQLLQSIEAGPSTEAAEGRCFAVVTMLHLGGREWIGGFGMV